MASECSPLVTSRLWPSRHTPGPLDGSGGPRRSGKDTRLPHEWTQPDAFVSWTVQPCKTGLYKKHLPGLEGRSPGTAVRTGSKMLLPQNSQAWRVWPHLPPGDHGPSFRDFAHVLSPDHHVPVVELDVHIGLLIDQVVSPSSWGQPHQFPEVTAQLMASRSLYL